MTIRHTLVRLACISSLTLAVGDVFSADQKTEPQTFAELHTEKGRTFVNAKVIAVEPDGLRLQHDTGVSKVAFWELPEAVRKNYPHDPEKAAEYARAAEAANRDAILAAEQERLRTEQAEMKRKAGVAPEVELDTDGPLTIEQVKARWLVSNAARSLNYGDRNYSSREADIASYRRDVQAGMYDREAEKTALRHNFEWYLKEGRTEQAALVQKRLASMEDEDLRREQIASMERLAKSVDRAAQGANSALMSELSSIRLELERLRLDRDSHP
ncbi:hypothetical protein DES53_1234 [Roseimicrobium gellanilyticum]|uniref:DUF5667 domain-containing protein n=1 Tax=Roseimicrobium gellanilyticum TaxID=748857 RepID=A0A366H2N4_9BACT|nr:hypothetical protein [Roseimicrobium gellanilyticum]RBP35308.1 hypothetical protein DES53_1234 [Roseimicrobium gellanilyticum]